MGSGGHCFALPIISPGFYGVGGGCFWCFSKDTKVTVLNGSNQCKKLISEIKEDDLVLTFNGSDKVFSKVLELKKNEGIFEFFIIKVRDKALNKKNIAVTGTHTMIIFGRDNYDIKLKYACELKEGDLLRTNDGLFEIYEIERQMMYDSYQIVVENGTILANDILVSTIYSTENNRKAVTKILDSIKIPIEIKN